MLKPVIPEGSRDDFCSPEGVRTRGLCFVQLSLELFQKMGEKKKALGSSGHFQVWDLEVQN